MFRTIFKLFRTLVLLTIIAVIGLGLLIIESQPKVSSHSAPTSEDVVEARSFVRNVKAALSRAQTAPNTVASNEDQLNSAIKLGARLIPGFRGQVDVQDQAVTGRISVPVPHFKDKWINLRATVPAFEGEFSLSDVAVGRMSLPPTLTLMAARLTANQVLGDQKGNFILASAEGIDVTGDQLTFHIAKDLLGETGSNGIMRSLFGALRGGEMPDPEDIGRHYRNIRTAMDTGLLPTEGSYLPYLQFTLQAALADQQIDDLQNAYTAALFALTMACGAKDFSLVVGGVSEVLAEHDRAWGTDCNDLTLNGRIDSRRHFTTAAAIQAASNRGVAVSIGEFKELYDASKSGGFDFTDIAANNSGIRMSNRLMAAPKEGWPALMSAIQSERDVIMGYDGVPGIMSAADFESIYGDVDDARYQTMLQAIEAKIDQLALHQM